LARFVVAYEQIAHPIGTVRNGLGLLVRAVGAAQAIDNVQIGSGDEDLIPFPGEVLKERL
jgi:hypothetical protein